MTISDKTDWIKEAALALGFMGVGIAKPENLSKEGDKLKEWLGLGYQGTMSYLDNHFELRTDPTKLVPGTKSILCFSYNYFPEQVLNCESPKVAKYAYGRDYHKVVKKKLKLLYQKINEKFGEVSGRYFVDSAPVMERDWAQRAGLGWVGKNTLLIHPKQGSFFFLAEMMIDLELEYDEVPIKDHCGTCTRCIDACPTDAIMEEGYLMDASKCISYLTIELKEEEMPEEFNGKMEDWAFGCDICQDVCPWNKFSVPHDEPDFLPSIALQNMQKEDWQSLTQEKFDALFEGSAVKRTGYDGLRRNIAALSKTS